MIESKKILILVLIILTHFSWFSCKNEVYDRMLAEQQVISDSFGKSVDGRFSQIPKNRFESISYEGCEYLIYKEELDSNSEMGYMAHKGNCRNPIHNPILDCSCCDKQ